LKSQKYDLIWLEKEALPWLPAWLELLLLRGRTPYLVDYDDAVFHRYDQHSASVVRWLLAQKIDRVMQNARLVIAGNDYLANRATQAGAKWVEILPTVVDIDRYPLSKAPQNEVFTIGWIGTPLKFFNYIKELAPVLKEICRDGGAKVVAIGAKETNIEDIPLEIKPWSEATEVKEMQQFDVGIMPLTDTPFERGKCGFKLIQYMASSRPVIGSPVGVNAEIIEQGINGFHASSQAEWLQAFQKLKNDRYLRESMGLAGRKLVEDKYNIKITAPRLLQLLQAAVQVKKT
jgi:glycosyltransferase involved in cell wall biosynthesis